MFDIGFSEVLLIFVIALIVLGPEKLPRLAAQVGRWIGRARAMARQFREQLEEEVNLEEVRKAQKAQAKKPEETTPPASATDAPSPSNVHDASTSAAAGDLQPDGSAQGATTDASAPWHSSQAAASENHPAQATGSGTSQTAAESTPFGSYQGPDPAEFRADTFSHAHPTNEFGANPYTSTGAAEEQSPVSAAYTGHSTSSEHTASAEQAIDDAETPSEANVAAAQPEPRPVVTEKREAPVEAYAAVRPRDNTPGTDNHGNE
jgi:sec-independent protein translocase protein TatB